MTPTADEIRQRAQSMLDNGCRGPLPWARSIFEFVVNAAAPPAPTDSEAVRLLREFIDAFDNADTIDYAVERIRAFLSAQPPAVDAKRESESTFEWLCRKYVQRSDARQIAMGLQYMEAETHDLAEEIDRRTSSQQPIQVPLSGEIAERSERETERGNSLSAPTKPAADAPPADSERGGAVAWQVRIVESPPRVWSEFFGIDEKMDFDKLVDDLRRRHTVETRALYTAPLASEDAIETAAKIVEGMGSRAHWLVAADIRALKRAGRPTP